MKYKISAKITHDSIQLFFRENFDDDLSFCENAANEESSDSTEDELDLGSAEEGELAVQLETSCSQLIEDIKQNGFCISDLMLKWLKEMSMFWEKKLPREIIECYLKIYELHL